MDSESSQSIEEQKQDNFLAYSSAGQGQKQMRQKLTILDDIDELNENINGPGALEDQLKTKQIIQETFDKINQEHKGKKQSQFEAKENTQNTKQSHILIQNMKENKAHGLVAYTMKIDLSQPPSEENLFLLKADNKMILNCAPRNSYKRGQGFDLFGRALETERNQNKKFSHFRI